MAAGLLNVLNPDPTMIGETKVGQGPSLAPSTCQVFSGEESGVSHL